MNIDHTIIGCEEFKKLLQRMMDQGEIELSKKVIEESINVITDAKFVGESSLKGSKPLTIFFEDDSILVANMTMHPPKLAVEMLSPFPIRITRWCHGATIAIM